MTLSTKENEKKKDPIWCLSVSVTRSFLHLIALDMDFPSTKKQHILCRIGQKERSGLTKLEATREAALFFFLMIDRSIGADIKKSLSTDDTSRDWPSSLRRQQLPLLRRQCQRCSAQIAVRVRSWKIHHRRWRGSPWTAFSIKVIINQFTGLYAINWLVPIDSRINHQ